jgi:hypothetical protein
LEEGARGWIDVIDGDEDAHKAIANLTQQGVDSVDEEDLETMKANIAEL